MAWRLTRDQMKERDRFIERLNKAYEEVERSVSDANESMHAILEKVNVDIQEYNAVAEEAKAFVQGLADTFRSDFDDKSERWQESDRGQEIVGWIETFEEAEIEELTEASLPDLDMADVGDNAASSLEELEEVAPS